MANLTSAVYDELRRSLFSGRLRAGEVLRLRSLAEALGTSVQPVRDAVQRLVAEGALELALNRAIRVGSLSRDSLIEIYRIRNLLEGEAAAMAASRDEMDVRAAEASIAAMVAASEASDTAAYSAANFDFHFGIYRAAGSVHLMPLIETLWLKIGPMLDIGGPVGGSGGGGPGGVSGRTRAQMRLFEGQDAHRRILDAIARRDPDGARAGIEEDLTRGRDWFLTHQALPATDGVETIRPLSLVRAEEAAVADAAATGKGT